MTVIIQQKPKCGENCYYYVCNFFYAQTLYITNACKVVRLVTKIAHRNE